MSALASFQPASGWDCTTYGELLRPVHKSDNPELVGPFACPARFQFKCDAEVRGEHRPWMDAKAALGTAAHEVLARVLRHRPIFNALGSGPVQWTPGSLEKVLRQEWMRATQDREVRWYHHKPAAEFKRIATMLAGVLADVRNYVLELVLAEAGFIFCLNGIWYAGGIDLVARPTDAPDSLIVVDWKTGAKRAHPLELQHGAEGAIYSAALLHGTFLPEETVKAWRRGKRCPELSWRQMQAVRRAPDQRKAMHAALRAIGELLESGAPLPEDAVQFGQFPSAIYQVHLADYVPYTKSGRKTVSRSEEVRFYGLTDPGKVSYQAGEQRGPAWYRTRRKESDVPRMEHVTGRLVSMVRAGYLVEAPGEQCSRCPFASECLNEGYHLRGSEAEAVEALLRDMPADNDGGLCA